jgi:hypothetical protein
LLIESARVDESKVIFRRLPTLESSWIQRPSSEPQTSAVDAGAVRVQPERVDGDRRDPLLRWLLGHSISSK